MSIDREKHSWGEVELWAKSANFLGMFYSINSRESVSIPICNLSDSTYRVSSGVLLVREDREGGDSDGTIVKAGDVISLKKGNSYIFSAIRDCEVYGIIPKLSGEKVGKKN